MEMIDIDTDKRDFKLYLIGDLHIGNKSSAVSEIEKSFDHISEQDNYYVVGMGDLIEAIIANDRRFSLDQMSNEYRTIDEQVFKVVDEFEKVQDGLIGLIKGNHEYKLKQHTDTDMNLQMCKHLDVMSLGFSSYIKFKNREDEVDVILHHGYGGGRTTGSKINKIEDFAKSFQDIDLVGMGHHHILANPSPIVRLKRNGSDLNDVVTHLLYTGSFLKNYESGTVNYGERFGYRPLPIGFAEVEVKDMEIDNINLIYAENGGI